VILDLGEMLRELNQMRPACFGSEDGTSSKGIGYAALTSPDSVGPSCASPSATDDNHSYS